MAYCGVQQIETLFEIKKESCGDENQGVFCNLTNLETIKSKLEKNSVSFILFPNFKYF